MPLHNDGDLVRAYGFVAIRFADLEDGVDERLRQTEPLLPNVSSTPLDSILRWRFSDRVKALRSVFRWAKTNGPSFVRKDQELPEAEEALAQCLKAATERNDTLHSPIIADLRTGDVIRHSRDFGPHPVQAAEVYELANDIQAVASAVGRLRFTLNSILGRPRLS